MVQETNKWLQEYNTSLQQYIVKNGDTITKLQKDKTAMMETLSGLRDQSSSLKNQLDAIRLKDNSGKAADDFLGVPVFQSKSLALKSQGRSYRPAFFRKEDLEDTLFKASRDQGQFNPSFRKGNIEVSVLEEIISAMKGSSTSDWDDIVFIPPGFEVETAVRKETQNMSS